MNGAAHMERYATFSHNRMGVWHARDVRVMALLRLVMRERQEIRQLRALVDRQRQADRMRGEMLAGVTHDFRAPVQSIAGLAKSAQRHLQDSDRTDLCLQTILHASDYLLHLIDGMLDMSCAQAGRLDVRKAPFLPLETAACAAKLVAPQAAQRGQTMLVEQEIGFAGALLGDGQRLCQVMVNLLDNAVKYTPVGGEIALSVRTAMPDGAGRVGLRFAVRDNGIGMSGETMAQMFLPYARARGAAQVAAGTGLGLAICRVLVEAMGGTISVESRLGAGSTFTVALALPLSAEKAKEQKAADAPQPAAFAGKRFLLAEDNGINADLLREMLEEGGAQAEHVFDGAAAVALFCARPCGYFDAILMDLHMPVMDGFEAARAIRKLTRPDAAQIPILAMTASAGEQDRLDAIGSGMNARLVKPVEWSALALAWEAL